MYLNKEMFQPVSDREQAKRIFKSSVGRVEVETHSYCNRRCSYCPNVVGDRLGPNQRLDEDLFLLIAKNLGEIDYRNNIVLNNYNEPLFDRIILERIAQLREQAPNSRIMIYTNGDYLSPDYIEELAEAGLSYLHISIHLKMGDKFSDIYVLNRLSEIAVRIAIPARFTSIKSNEFVIAKFRHKKLEIETRAINFWKHGNDRGGLIADIKRASVRTDPCHFPFSHFYVGFSGNIMPCCHLRSDREEHEEFRIGNLSNFGSIFEAFTSAGAAAWRREMVHNNPKSYPCDNCSAPFLPNTDEAREAYERAHRQYAPTGSQNAQQKTPLGADQ